MMSRTGGGGYRDRPYPPGAADRYGGDYPSEPRGSWSQPHAHHHAPSEHDRARYEREREREQGQYGRERERERYDRDRDWRNEARYNVRDHRDPRAPAPLYGAVPQDARPSRDRTAERYPAAYDRRPSWNERERERAEWSSATSSSYHDIDAGRTRGPNDPWKRSPASPHRSGSPRSSRRSSPSSTRRASPALASTIPSSAPPTGPRARRTSPSASVRGDDRPSSSALSGGQSAASWTASAGEGYSAVPPTGPRRSFGRPPSGPAHATPLSVSRDPPRGPRFSSDVGYAASSRTPPSRSFERSPVALDPISTSNPLQQQQHPAPLSSSGTREGFSGRRSASHLHLPPPSPASATAAGAALATPGSFSGPSTPARAVSHDGTGKRIAWLEEEIKGSIHPRVEAEAYTLSLDRIRASRRHFDHPALQALRKAMNDLADSDVELAGARVKTSVTEAALERAREESEAWSIDTSRIELEQRNAGDKAYWAVSI